MTRPVSLCLLAGLVVAMVAATSHRRAAEARLDPATMTELSRRLDLVVSGASTNPELPLAHDLSAFSRDRVLGPH